MGEGDQAQAGAQLTGSSGLTASNPTQKVPNIFFSNPFPGVTTGGPLTYHLRHFDRSAPAGPDDAGVQPYDPVTSFPEHLPARYRRRGRAWTHNFISYNDTNMPFPILNPASTTLSIGNARRPEL